MFSHSTLVIGPSGSGKSYMAATMLRHYGSGIVAMAPGVDEINSYYPLYEDKDHFDFAGFDDPDFQPLLGEKKASGALNMVKWLKERFTALSAEAAEGKELSRKVVVFDTATGIGRLAMNATMAKFNYEEPPPVRGEKGYPFFTYLFNVQNGIFAKGRALRGLGLHWIVLAQAAERETTPEQAASNQGMSSKQIMASMPGGFKDVINQFFDNVFQVTAVPNPGKPSSHQLLWVPDPKRNTKSRWGSLKDMKLPNDWPTVLQKIEEAAMLKQK